MGKASQDARVRCADILRGLGVMLHDAEEMARELDEAGLLKSRAREAVPVASEPQAYQVLNGEGAPLAVWLMETMADEDAEGWRMNSGTAKPITVRPLYAENPAPSEQEKA